MIIQPSHFASPSSQHERESHSAHWSDDFAELDWDAFARALGADLLSSVSESEIATTRIGEPPRRLLSTMEWFPETETPLTNVQELISDGARLMDTTQLVKLFDAIAPRYTEHSGRYSSVVKAGIRISDTAQIAIIEFVDRDGSAKRQDSGPVMTDEEFEAA